jgi:hypothetical protein
MRAGVTGEIQIRNFLFRIFYIPSAEPDGIGEIVGIDTLRSAQIEAGHE